MRLPSIPPRRGLQELLRELLEDAKRVLRVTLLALRLLRELLA
jgi:hypothetical protein